MFKVNNKGTRTTPGVVLVSLLLNLIIYFTPFSRDSTVNFEQVNAGSSAFALSMLLNYMYSFHINIPLCIKLRKICENTGILWPVFYHIRTESKIRK